MLIYNWLPVIVWCLEKDAAQWKKQGLPDAIDECSNPRSILINYTTLDKLLSYNTYFSIKS